MYYHTNIKKNTHNLNKFLEKDNKEDKCRKILKNPLRLHKQYKRCLEEQKLTNIRIEGI